MPKQTITPGEWKWTDGDAPVDVATYRSGGYTRNLELHGPNGEFILGCDEYDILGFDDHRTPNAQAIAAVPDMIAALLRVIDGHDCRENGEDMTKECPTRTAVIAALRKAGQLD